MDATEAVLMARELLNKATPMRFDCGFLCGEACCAASEAGEGMLLFPGEKELYATMPEGFSIVRDIGAQNAWLLICGGTCRREDRPLSCRMFPLIPYIRRQPDGLSAGVAMDVRAWPICPLMENGIKGCAQSFVETLGQAARVLCAVPEHRRFIAQLTRRQDQYRDFS